MRRLLVPLIVFVALLGSAACGEKKPTSGVAGSLPTLAPGPSAASTTAPPSTIANTPECGAMYRFSLAQVTTANAQKDKQAEHLATVEKTAATAKQQVPQLAGPIDTTVELLKKSLAGPLDDADKARSRTAGQEIDKWWKANCV